MKYFLIGDEEALLGFQMVGVEGVSPRSKDEILLALEQAFSDSSIGIILITNALFKQVLKEVEKYIFTKDFPLILEIPDSFQGSKDQKSLKDRVNEAIGLKLS